ncbi:MAG TPA: alpha/beta hydrolase [Acidimicrobiia bacterium]|nr:alpha/beta hydrolase [Acidimicrobiia bacterium]
MEWIDEVDERGVRERGFTLECEGRTVPAVVWSPSSEAPRAVVLLGHGGGVHKRALGMPGQARSLVRHEGIAAVAIDAVGHGDRLPDGDREEAEAIERLQAQGVDMTSPEFRAVRRTRTPIDDSAFDAMVADWSATLDAVLDDLGDMPVGYAGFSMGSIYGTALTAAEPRITAAALGLSGIVDDGEGPMAEIGDRLEADSAKISCPVLFLVQADDEVVPRDAAFRQFATFASVHKRMHVNAGRHMHVPLDETPFIELFLASHLCGGSRRGQLAVDVRIPAED